MLLHLSARAKVKHQEIKVKCCSGFWVSGGGLPYAVVGASLLFVFLPCGN